MPESIWKWSRIREKSAAVWDVSTVKAAALQEILARPGVTWRRQSAWAIQKRTSICGC